MKKPNRCLDCNKKIDFRAKRCKSCAKKGRIISKKSIYYKKLLEDSKNIPLSQLKTYINE